MNRFTALTALYGKYGETTINTPVMKKKKKLYTDTPKYTHPVINNRESYILSLRQALNHARFVRQTSGGGILIAIVYIFTKRLSFIPVICCPL